MQSKNLNNAYLQCIAKIGCNITINSGCNYVKSEAKSFNIPAPMQNTIVSLIVLRYFKFAGKSITFKRNYSTIGLGNMGTAISNIIAKNGFKVLGWERSKHEVDEINTTHKNTTFLPELVLQRHFRVSFPLKKWGLRGVVLYSAFYNPLRPLF